MNYQKHYELLIERAKTRKLDCYTESHHIVPKCVGGSDDKENLVDLTPEEHYVAHQLLVKIYNGNYPLVRAAQMMIPNRPSNKLYGWLRRRFSEAQSESQKGVNNTQWGTMWVTNGEDSKKIKKSAPIPVGWTKGRKLKAQKKKICKKCGKENCINDICKKGQMLKTLIEYFNFDKNAVGSKDFFDEWERVRFKLEDEYHNKKMSIEDMKNKYNVTSNERLRYIFKSLGIKRRTLSESIKNYYK